MKLKKLLEFNKSRVLVNTIITENYDPMMTELDESRTGF
jgi:hypothetical protein